MGLPSINVNFVAKAQTVSQRAERGIVGLILKGEVPQENPITVFSEADIPEGMAAELTEQIKLALVGYVTGPRKVIAYILPSEATDYTEAFTFFDVNDVNYLAIPTVDTDKKKDEVVEWVKGQRQEGRKVKAVLPNTEGDNEGIINYTTGTLQIQGIKLTTEKACARIAGLLAGTPATISCTFAILPDAEDCTRLKRSELSTEIEKGHFVLFHDGTNVKVGRGVNSLVTTDAMKNDQFKKIKIVEAMDMIHDDIVKLVEENYIGKMANSYDNKCVLLSAVMDYFAQLLKEGILSAYTVGIDIEANKAYLKSKKVEVEEMTDEEIKTADTDEKVFLNATMRILDAIEDVDLVITV